jgi:hypothetical protein
MAKHPEQPHGRVDINLEGRFAITAPAPTMVPSINTASIVVVFRRRRRHDGRARNSIACSAATTVVASFETTWRVVCR